MSRFSLSAIALAIGLAAAPQLHAQTASTILVCRDGRVSSTRQGTNACRADGGIDNVATIRARQNGAYNSRGVYNGTVNGTVNSSRGIYNGTNNGANNGTYNRGVYNGGTNNGQIYSGNSRVYRDRDGDDDHHDNGRRRHGEKNKSHGSYSRAGDRDRG